MKKIYLDSLFVKWYGFGFHKDFIYMVKKNNLLFYLDFNTAGVDNMNSVENRVVFTDTFNVYIFFNPEI